MYITVGCGLVQDSESRGSDPIFRENSVSINVPEIIGTIPFRIVQFGFCLLHDVKTLDVAAQEKTIILKLGL